LYGWKQKGNQNGDDRDHDQQFNQRESTLRFCEARHFHSSNAPVSKQSPTSLSSPTFTQSTNSRTLQQIEVVQAVLSSFDVDDVNAILLDAILTF
jgi:hypothetical protein